MKGDERRESEKEKSLKKDNEYKKRVIQKKSK